MSAALAPTLHPLFLKLDGKEVLVVGGGRVAEAKIVDLAATGARVRVVSPKVTSRVEALARAGKIRWHRRAFWTTDVDGAWLVIAATSDPDVQRSASDAADARRTFAVAVDDLPNGSAYSAAVLRRAPFTIAVSSSGEAPALARLLREILEQVLPEHGWVDAARALREKWRRDKTPMDSRFGELVRVFRVRATTPSVPRAS